MKNENNEVMNDHIHEVNDPKTEAVELAMTLKCENSEQKRCVGRFIADYLELIDCYGEDNVACILNTLNNNLYERFMEDFRDSDNSCQQEGK